MQHEKLVMMANQIAKFFETQGTERGLPQVASHIELFWNPRMRRQILAHVAEGGAGLSPLALAALKTLKAPAAPQHEMAGN
jgi:formate dehydrogenase subunit delta